MAEIKLTQFLKQASRLIKEKKTYVGVCLLFFQEHTRRFEFQSFSYFLFLPAVHDENKWHIYARKERIKPLLKHLVRIVRNVNLGRPLHMKSVRLGNHVQNQWLCSTLNTKQNGRMK